MSLFFLLLPRPPVSGSEIVSAIRAGDVAAGKTEATDVFRDNLRGDVFQLNNPLLFPTSANTAERGEARQTNTPRRPNRWRHPDKDAILKTQADKWSEGDKHREALDESVSVLRPRSGRHVAVDRRL